MALNHIWDLKHKAHGLIDEIMFSGKMSKKHIYATLCVRTKIKPFHLKNINTVTQLKQIISILNKIKNKLKITNKIETKRNNLLSAKEEMQLEKLMAMRRKIISHHGRNEELIRRIMIENLK